MASTRLFVKPFELPKLINKPNRPSIRVQSRLEPSHVNSASGSQRGHVMPCIPGL